jgi:hypothetical protein
MTMTSLVRQSSSAIRLAAVLCALCGPSPSPPLLTRADSRTGCPAARPPTPPARPDAAIPEARRCASLGPPPLVAAAAHTPHKLRAAQQPPPLAIEVGCGGSTFQPAQAKRTPLAVVFDANHGRRRRSILSGNTDATISRDLSSSRLISKTPPPHLPAEGKLSFCPSSSSSLLKSYYS